MGIEPMIFALRERRFTTKPKSLCPGLTSVNTQLYLPLSQLWRGFL